MFSPTFAFFGDFGAENPVSLPELQRETHDGELDLVVHAGDMGYDMNDVSPLKAVLAYKLLIAVDII